MVKSKYLGDIIVYLPGGALKRNDVKDTGLYPVMNGGIDYSGYYDEYNYDENVLTISHWGSSASHVHRHFKKFWANNACWIFACKDNSEYNLFFLYYYLKNMERCMMQTMCFGGATPNLSRALFEKIEVPAIPLEEQEKIVEKLDTFTSLISKLDEEIELRKQQLTHCRNMLLDLNENEGFEIKTLGQIGSFTRGNGIQKSDFVDKGKPCIHYGQIHTRFGISTDKVVSYIPESQYKKCKKAKYGDIILATTSEDVEAVCKPVAWLGSEEVAVSTDAFIYSHQCNPIFMANQFLTDRYFSFKASHTTGAKVIRISDSAMSKYEICLPSLKKQIEIGNKLTTFTLLISKLDEERDLRQKQYEYYREKLLTFE